MRFNEKELVCLSRQPSEMAAELGMRGPKKGDVVKKRLVKLVVNFLFYFRTDEEEDPLEQYGISDETRFQVSNGLQLKQRDTSSL
eukprot:superscaffoldBa00002728_g15120